MALEKSKDALPGPSAPQHLDGLFQAVENCKPNSLAAAAAKLLQDESYRQMYDTGMSSQLQRTKDGATDRSRIKELAGAASRSSLDVHLFIRWRKLVLKYPDL